MINHHFVIVYRFTRTLAVPYILMQNIPCIFKCCTIVYVKQQTPCISILMQLMGDGRHGLYYENVKMSQQKQRYELLRIVLFIRRNNLYFIEKPKEKDDDVSYV